jgi:DNA-binding helix-hairpin-helix protein with protein kinase domain
MEDDEPTGYIQYEKLSKVAFKLLLEDVLHPFDPIYATITAPPPATAPVTPSNATEENGEDLMVAPTNEPKAPLPQTDKKCIYLKSFDEELLERAFRVLQRIYLHQDLGY